MTKIQKKAKEPEYYVAKVERLDGSTESIKFYDSYFSSEGVSLMLIPKRKLLTGKLGVGECFIPWTSVLSVECWTAKELPII